MSATMARQGGRVQLGQSNMRLALNMAEMATAGCSHAILEETQHLIENPCTEVWEGKKQGVLFCGHQRWRLRWKDTRQWFEKIRWTAAFHSKMAHQRICRHTWGGEARVHLDQIRLHLRPECHLCHLVIMRERQVPKSKLCHPDMCINILPFPTINFSILIHMPRIASTIKIFVQICQLMKEHPLVSTLSAAWKCSWQPFCRWEHPIEQTWQWWQALIERNRIFE